MTTAIAEYSKTEAALAELAQKYKGVVWNVTNPTEMIEAKKARAEIRGYRTSLEKMRVQIKAPALERCRLIDTEAKRITQALEELENPIDEQIRAEEQKKERERLEKERIEAERIAAEEKAKKDAEEARMSAERAEIARKQAEIAAAEKALQDKIEAEERAARLRIEEQERKARMEREEADRQARLAREAEEAKARKVREEEDARLKAERDKLEAERRAEEDRKRKEREAEEARLREIRRQQAELADARGMLEMFVERYGHLKEFGRITPAIQAFLKDEKAAA